MQHNALWRKAKTRFIVICPKAVWEGGRPQRRERISMSSRVIGVPLPQLHPAANSVHLYAEGCQRCAVAAGRRGWGDMSTQPRGGKLSDVRLVDSWDGFNECNVRGLRQSGCVRSQGEGALWMETVGGDSWKETQILRPGAASTRYLHSRPHACPHLHGVSCHRELAHSLD
jgi:hypothetical protein